MCVAISFYQSSWWHLFTFTRWNQFSATCYGIEWNVLLRSRLLSPACAILVDIWQLHCSQLTSGHQLVRTQPCWLWSNGIKLFTYFNHTGWQAIDWIVVDVVTRLCNLSLSWDMFELSTWWWSQLTCWNCIAPSWRLVAITHQWERYQALQSKVTMLTMTMVVVEHVPIYFRLICFGKTHFVVLFKTREVESWKWKSCADLSLDFGRSRNVKERECEPGLTSRY